MKKVLILGSTGSIGTQTLEVINFLPGKFKIVGLSVNTKIDQLSSQCKEFDVNSVHIFDEKSAKIFSSKNTQIKVFSGKNGLSEIVSETDFDILLNALSGEIGILPTLKAIERGKIIALANKETLVAAGQKIMRLARKHKSDIRPVDSEHSAIWQCLQGEKLENVKKIFLTCSGGPFCDRKKWPIKKLSMVKPEHALRHPNWDMGEKISIDSATLMNKALEIIEAVRLFDLRPDQIEVVIHPESILHSAVEFTDGSIKAQMGAPDMRTAISYALNYPDRPVLPFKKFSFFDANLTFEKVDNERFPSVEFAYKALEKGENACAALNVANEKAVADYLNCKIGFLEIFKNVQNSLN